MLERLSNTTARIPLLLRARGVGAVVHIATTAALSVQIQPGLALVHLPAAAAMAALSHPCVGTRQCHLQRFRLAETSPTHLAILSACHHCVSATLVNGPLARAYGYRRQQALEHEGNVGATRTGDAKDCQQRAMPKRFCQ